MTGNPTQQTFNVVWPTNMPATVLANNDVVGTFNDIPSSTLNTTLTETIGGYMLLSSHLDITSAVVIGAHFIEHNGHLALSFALQTQSDPITIGDVIAILAVVGAIVVAALVAMGLASGIVPGLIALGFVSIGVLALLEPIISAGAAIITAITTYAIPAVVLIGGGLLAYALVTNKPLREKASRHAVEYTGKAARAAAGLAKRVITA